MCRGCGMDMAAALRDMPTNELQKLYMKDPPELREFKEVVVRDIDMHFWTMVIFMVKWSLASIPAIIILLIIGAVLVSILGGIGDILKCISDY